MKTIQLNDFCELDLSDTIVKKFVRSKYWFNLPSSQPKRVAFEVADTAVFARLVAKQKFVVKGKVVEAGERGGYLQINRFGRSAVKLGKKSWVENSFRGTDAHKSFVMAGTKIGDGTLVGMNTYVGPHAVIGSGALVGSTCVIGANCVVDDNVWLEDCTLGPKTEIAHGTTVGIFHLDGKRGIQGRRTLLGVSPNYHQNYWWNLGAESSTLGPESFHIKDIWRRLILEGYYKNLQTRIGKDVQIGYGARILAGATVGDGAHLGYNVSVGLKGQVENQSVVANKECL